MVVTQTMDQWIEGGLYTGYACLSAAEVNDIKSFLRNTDNQQRIRFCQNAPPILTDTNNPVGGCDWWSCGNLIWGKAIQPWWIIVLPVIILTTFVIWLVYKRARISAVDGSTRK